VRHTRSRYVKRQLVHLLLGSWRLVSCGCESHIHILIRAVDSQEHGSVGAVGATASLMLLLLLLIITMLLTALIGANDLHDDTLL
jgi:hypothetical protein